MAHVADIQAGITEDHHGHLTVPTLNGSLPRAVTPGQILTDENAIAWNKCKTYVYVYNKFRLQIKYDLWSETKDAFCC